MNTKTGCNLIIHQPNVTWHSTPRNMVAGPSFFLLLGCVWNSDVAGPDAGQSRTLLYLLCTAAEVCVKRCASCCVDRRAPRASCGGRSDDRSACVLRPASALQRRASFFVGEQRRRRASFFVGKQPRQKHVRPASASGVRPASCVDAVAACVLLRRRAAASASSRGGERWRQRRASFFVGEQPRRRASCSRGGVRVLRKPGRERSGGVRVF